MKQILKYTKIISGTFLAGNLLFTSCTGQFEKWNINPNEVTREQMTQDNLNTGAYFTINSRRFQRAFLSPRWNMTDY